MNATAKQTVDDYASINESLFRQMRQAAEPRKGELREEILRLNSPLIGSIGRKTALALGLEWDEDLEHETYIKLLQAVDKYDPDHPSHATFATYSFPFFQRLYYQLLRKKFKVPSLLSLTSPVREDENEELLLIEQIAAPASAKQRSFDYFLLREQIIKAIVLRVEMTEHEKVAIHRMFFDDAKDDDELSNRIKRRVFLKYSSSAHSPAMYGFKSSGNLDYIFSDSQRGALMRRRWWRLRVRGAEKSTYRV